MRSRGRDPSFLGGGKEPGAESLGRVEGGPRLPGQQEVGCLFRGGQALLEERPGLQPQPSESVEPQPLPACLP